MWQSCRVIHTPECLGTRQHKCSFFPLLFSSSFFAGGVAMKTLPLCVSIGYNSLLNSCKTEILSPWPQRADMGELDELEHTGSLRSFSNCLNRLRNDCLTWMSQTLVNLGCRFYICHSACPPSLAGRQPSFWRFFPLHSYDLSGLCYLESTVLDKFHALPPNVILNGLNLL